MKNKKALFTTWLYLANNGTQHGSGSIVPAARSSSEAAGMLNLCFVTTIPTSPQTIPAGNGDSITIAFSSDIQPHEGLNTLEYMSLVRNNARATNPAIRIGATLENGENGHEDVLSKIFRNTSYTDQENADRFAANLAAYLVAMDLDGFDINWEWPLSTSLSPRLFNILVQAIRIRFNSFPGRNLYLTLSPANVGKLDKEAVNSCMDGVNLQLYANLADPDDFISAGIDKELFVY